MTRPGSAPRVAFLRMGPHPIPNRLLPPELAAALGGAPLRVFDVERAVRRDPISWLVNPLYVLAEHGLALARRRVRPWRAFFTTTWMFRRMSRLARRFVEREGCDLSFQIQSLFDGRVEGTPHFVYTDHTHLSNLDYPDFDRTTLRGPRWIALERDLYAGAAVVFTRSGHVSRALTRRYGLPPERVLCVGAGSNVPTDADATAKRPAEAPRILFVGVDWERKGGPELAEAFSRLRDRHPDARLVVVGCRPTLDLPNVDVVGPCPVDAVARHYREASIFCLPVRREPFGVVFVEAMHHGLPIVSTRIGAVPDLVQHGANGLLVEVGDVEDLAACLDRLLADPETRRKLGERSLERARDGHTWPAVAGRMAEAMSEIP